MAVPIRNIAALLKMLAKGGVSPAHRKAIAAGKVGLDPVPGKVGRRPLLGKDRLDRELTAMANRPRRADELAQDWDKWGSATPLEKQHWSGRASSSRRKRGPELEQILAGDPDAIARLLGLPPGGRG